VESKNKQGREHVYEMFGLALKSNLLHKTQMVTFLDFVVIATKSHNRMQSDQQTATRFTDR
jgi:hypothetical protein